MPQYDDYRIQNAICFLVNKFTQSGHNPKPVILHSIRVAMRVYELNYPENTVIAALLHDLIEDTDTTKKEISKEFGEEVSNMVQSLSFNPEITDKTEKYKQEYANAIAGGKETLTIKAADIYDNSFHYYKAKDKDQYLWLVEKFNYFLSITKNMETEPFWIKLKEKQKEINSYAFPS